METFRSLYWVIILDPGLRILKEWYEISYLINILTCRELLNKMNYCKNLWGLIIHIFLYFSAFYLSFCFCAVYNTQAFTWMLAFMTTIIIDLLIFELIWEIIISLFYLCRKKSRSILRVAEFLNRIRNIKCLA